MTPATQPNHGTDIIYAYTQEEAEDDGILVQSATLLPPRDGYRPHIVSLITTRLLEAHGYLTEGAHGQDYKRANIIDLLNQAGPKITAALREKPDEWLVTNMRIESPKGGTFEAWAQQNETGRWTLMLPEDY